MNDTIQTLLEIQDLDAQIEELQNERDERPRALKREQDAVAAGESKVAAEQQRQKEAQATVDRLNTVLAGREDHIKKHQLSMLAPKISNKEYKAIQNEIASITADNALTEEQILEAMEEVDGFVAKVEEARRELAGHEVALEKAGERVEKEMVLFDRQIEEIEESRKGKLASLASEVIMVYERVHEARGSSVVAAITEGFCQGCYMQVTTQDVALILRADRLHQCKTCQRILYVQNPGDWITGD